jgi:hypothetical protein
MSGVVRCGCWEHNYPVLGKPRVRAQRVCLGAVPEH